MSVAPRMASRWRSRFPAQGVAGLLKDAPRPGRRPMITAEDVGEIVAKTTRQRDFYHVMPQIASCQNLESRGPYKIVDRQALSLFRLK